MAHESQPFDRILSDDDSLVSSDAALVQDITPQLHTQSRVYHLEPRSWQDFLQLEPPPLGHYDLVDGIVIWRPPMASKAHDNLIAAYIYILTHFICDAYTYSTPSLQVIDEGGNLQWTRSHSNAPSITAISSHELYGLRHPDIIVARRTSDSSIDSRRSGNDAGSAGQIQFAHPYRRRIKMIIEITSHSNRDEDLYVKWATYARSGVDLYVILDRGTDQNRNLRVIVGSAKEIPGYELSCHGDPDLSPYGRPYRTLKLSRSGAASPVNHTSRYYRKVFQHNELVSCEYFSELKKSPEHLLNDKYMTKISKSILNEQGKQKRRTEQAEHEAKEAKHEAKEAKHEAKEAKHEAKEAKHEAKEAKHEAKEARHEAKKARDRAENAEASAATLAHEAKEAQETIIRLKALLESATSQGKDSYTKVRGEVHGTSTGLSSPRTPPPQTPSKRHSSKDAPRSSKTSSPQTKAGHNSSAGSLSPKKKSRRKQ